MDNTPMAPSPGYSLLHGELTGKVIGAFYEVYNTLRYGFLESVYANALAMELGDRGMRFEREVGLGDGWQASTAQISLSRRSSWSR